MAETAMITFDKVCKRFGDSVVLDEVSFAVKRGEMFFIIGPSGTGKSVTLKHIAGLLAPDAGKVSAASEHIGYLFQSGALLAWMTVWDNVALPLREASRLSEDEIEKKVNDALTAVGMLDAGEKFPSEISGGMQKRAGLARSIVRASDIILYDEPTSGLDPVTARSIDNLIARLNRERGITSVVVTHDLSAALRMADRILLLKNGKAAFCGAPAEFAASQQPEVAEFVSAMKGGLD